MTGSRARLLLGAAALFAAMVPAMAQWTSDKPPVLRPEDYPPLATEDPPASKAGAKSDDGATAAPKPLNGRGQNSGNTDVQTLPAPGAAPNATMVTQPAPVEVGALGTPEGPPVGTLDSATGGFGDHVWSGSERATAADLLAKAPIVSADPVLRDLNRRLILTKAGAPPGQAKRAFITVRLERLMDAGLIQEAGAIAAQASVPNDEDFARTQAKAILYANRAQDVCGPATQMRASAGEVFWLRLRAYCAAVTGDTATAGLTHDVLAAQGHGDAAFDTLMENVLNKKAVPPGAIALPGAIHLFLMQQAGLSIPEAVARRMGTPANLLVLRDSRNPPRARFEAAERIVSTGAVPATELRQIADVQDLPLSKVANAAADAPNLPYFMGQVLLRRAASVEQRPEAKAQLMAEALSLGEKAKLLPLTAALQADVLATLKPSPATKQYARAFARALVLAKRYDAASLWAGGDPVMKAVVALASQDGARLAAAQADLSAFALSLAKNPPDPDADRSYKALVLGLADALDMALPPDAKAAAASAASQSWDGKRPDGGQMRAIEEAVQAPDRRGEAMLRLTGQVQTLGLRDMAPDATIEFVRLLNAMNETKAARAFALEALAQYAPPAAAAAAGQTAAMR